MHCDALEWGGLGLRAPSWSKVTRRPVGVSFLLHPKERKTGNNFAANCPDTEGAVRRNVPMGGLPSTLCNRLDQ